MPRKEFGMCLPKDPFNDWQVLVGNAATQGSPSGWLCAGEAAEKSDFWFSSGANVQARWHKPVASPGVPSWERKGRA